MQVRKSARQHAISKLGTVARKGADARIVRRQAGCIGGCDRNDAQLKAAGVGHFSALVASSGYGRQIVCDTCLEKATKGEGFWPNVRGKGQGRYDWRIEVRPFGDPHTQEGVTVALFERRQGIHWYPCETGTDQLAWRRAEPSIKWTDCMNTLEFQGLHGTVTIWVRWKGDGDKWVKRAHFIWRGAAHFNSVLQACKL